VRFFVLLLVAAAPAHGQGPSPDAVVRDAFRALDERRWHDVAMLAHPEALRAFRDERVAGARMLAQAPRMDVSLAADVGLPACVTEYFNSLGASQAQPGLLRDFAGIDSAAALERLPADQALALWIQAHDRGERMRSFRPSTPPGVTDVPKLAVERVVLGAIMDGDSLAHVTFRETERVGPDLIARDGYYVVSLRRAPAGWRLLIGEPVFGYRPLPLPPVRR
jgi:hypothetical protein